MSVGERNASDQFRSLRAGAHVIKPDQVELQPLRILDEQGRLVGDSHLDVSAISELYRAMLVVRTYDRKATAMQLQGRLATYSPLLGQEACQVGCAAALEEEDWLVGTYRDAGAMWYCGYGWQTLFLNRTGDERGGSPPGGVRVLPPSITVGAHMIHAVGLGWSSKLRRERSVALTLFGDGATSEGDFHEAMNFAGVYGTPTIFFCQNNQYAISAHFSSQTASAGIAKKAIAYGMPGYLVDGNDLIAVHAIASTAVARARSGDGPSLIEALTYRMGPHTTADDARRYRAAEEEEEWKSRDPLERVRLYLESNGSWDPSWEEEVQSSASAEIERAVSAAEDLEPLTPEEYFDSVFATTPTFLMEQAEASRRRAEGH